MTTGYQIPPGFSPGETRPAAGTDAPATASADLCQEAANMLELLSRQSPSFDLLSVTSKAAQAVIRQF
jgi:hypothetical protein